MLWLSCRNMPLLTVIVSWRQSEQRRQITEAGALILAGEGIVYSC